MKPRDWQTQAVLIPIGVRSKKWLTPLTVNDCRHEVEARSSALLGMQVYDAALPVGNSALRLRVRFRPWWHTHQVGELVVDLKPETDTSHTAVTVEAGLRVGAVILLMVWAAVVLIPILVFPTLPTKIFFGVVLAFPLISAFINARLQVRLAMHRLRAALPDVSDRGRQTEGGGASVC